MVAERKTIVGYVFRILCNWEHGTFLLKALEKVRAECSLSCLTYNLRQILNLVALAGLCRRWAAADCKRRASESERRGCLLLRKRPLRCAERASGAAGSERIRARCCCVIGGESAGPKPPPWEGNFSYTV